ncbi:DUF1990 family protein [Streptomyces sp. NPDC002537]
MTTFTYPEVGATAPGGTPPGGYHRLRVPTRVGHGRACFEAAADVLLSWGMHRAMPWVRITDAPRAAPGVTVTVSLGAGPLRVSGTCAVVWTVAEPGRAGFAYGTLPGHPERGEEAFLVTLDDAGEVWLTVTAFSRPAAWFTRCAGPLVPAVQQAYARNCGRALRGEVARRMR